MSRAVDVKDEAADHPQPAVGLEHALGFGQPLAGEIVVDLETVELVPVIGHCIDMAAVGPVEIAAELHIDEIDVVVGPVEHDAGARGAARSVHQRRVHATNLIGEIALVETERMLEVAQDARRRRQG